MITGPGSTWSCSRSLTVGHEGTGTIAVTDGGSPGVLDGASRLVEALRPFLDDVDVNPINARALARSRGFKVTEATAEEARGFPSMIRVQLKTECHVGHQLVLKGEATVLARSSKFD